MARRSTSAQMVLGAAVLALVLAGFASVPMPALAQDASAVPGDLSKRLPAAVGDVAVKVALTMDAQTWIGEAFTDETGPEFAALDAALAGQDRTRADVQMTFADVGPDLAGQIVGFRVPGGDAAALRDAIIGVWFSGFGEQTRTEQDVAGHPVLLLSEGPLETASYPSAVLVDGDAVWIATAEEPLLHQAAEALVGAWSGTTPRYVPKSPGIADVEPPESWEGTTRTTVTWDKASYKGKATATFTGSWIIPELSRTSYCAEPGCTAYIPAGTIDWTFESSAPTRPRCHVQTSGSLSPGAVVIPQDQMLYVEPADDAHLRYWGSGTMFLPSQGCPGWEGMPAPGSFFWISQPEDSMPNADESTVQHPSCGLLQWRIPRDGTTMSGRCWVYDEPGYEEVVEWDLTAGG